MVYSRCAWQFGDGHQIRARHFQFGGKSGTFTVYSTPDAVVRYSVMERLSPRQGGNAVQ
jgi:hypothetical protein